MKKIATILGRVLNFPVSVYPLLVVFAAIALLLTFAPTRHAIAQSYNYLSYGSDGTANHPMATSTGGTLAIGTSGMPTSANPVANIVGPVWQGAGTPSSSFAAAPYSYNGSSLDLQFYCPNTTTIPSTANTTSAILVAASGSQKIHICSFILSGNGTAGTMDIIYGTTANCASGTTTLTGTVNVLGTTAPPVTFAGGPGGALTTPASQAVCVRAVTTTVTGSFTWAQF